MKTYFAHKAYINSRWENSVKILVNNQGIITNISIGDECDYSKVLPGLVVPGMPNLHSHAFQRAMAGMTEFASNKRDSFWTWREQMYRLVSKMTAEQVGKIASHLYINMLKGGYTQVAEFNYLHHDPDGNAYTQDDIFYELVNAAKFAGIGQTLLPVLYSYSGFGSLPAVDGQKRFIQTTDSYVRQSDRIGKLIKNESLVNQGICFHSLRAVNESQINQVLNEIDSYQNVHIHIAEQQQEVNACLVWSGQRPVEWLLDRFEIDERWCLIHATHLSDNERKQLAKTNAVAGLCPTTEANLGDGIFPAGQYQSEGGKWGIGSDSHVSVNIMEELRWLEYSQRLRDQRRNMLTNPETPYVADLLFTQAAYGGALACGVKTGKLEVGYRADWLVLNDESWLSSIPDEHILNRWIFGGDKTQIKDVWVSGKQVIYDGHHPAEYEANSKFNNAMKELWFE